MRVKQAGGYGKRPIYHTHLPDQLSHDRQRSRTGRERIQHRQQERGAPDEDRSSWRSAKSGGKLRRAGGGEVECFCAADNRLKFWRSIPRAPPAGATSEAPCPPLNPLSPRKTRLTLREYRIVYILFRYNKRTKDGAVVKNASCRCWEGGHQRVQVLRLGVRQVLLLVQEGDVSGGLLRWSCH